MKALLGYLSTKAQLWILRSCEVARFDGIILADPRNPSNRTPHFREVILAALRLLKQTDPYRYARVRRRLSWIVYTRLNPHTAAEYQHGTRTCAIDVRELSSAEDLEFLVGWNALVLVHEATHGGIRSRGIQYTPEHRLRIEQLCVKEEQAFVRRLASKKPDLASRLSYEFDASLWEWSWNTGRWEGLLADLRRALFPPKRDE